MKWLNKGMELEKIGKSMALKKQMEESRRN